MFAKGSQDRMWADTFVPGQTLFRFDGDRVFVMTDNDTELHQGCLLNRFPFKDDLLTLREIAIQLTKPVQKLQSKTDIESFSQLRYPDALLYPNAKLEMEFEIKPLPPVTDRASLEIKRALKRVR